MKKIENKVIHTLKPIFNNESKVLILGTIPSIKSRENSMYYSHPKNRFWIVLATIFNDVLPQTNKEKEEFILKHNLALWDVLKSCKIKGSSDSSITEPEINDFNLILSNCDIKAIFTTGTTPTKLFNQLSGNKSTLLPSTSPANCKISFEELVKEYSKILDYLN